METSWRRNYLRYKSFFLNMLTQYRERSDWKAYLEILLSLTTVSIFSVFALRPTILTIAELIGQIEEKKDTVAKMDAKIQNLSKAQNLYDRERSNIVLLTENVIPAKPNSDIFARQMEGLSSKHGVVISSISLGKATVIGKSTSPITPPLETQNSDVSAVANKLDFAITATVPIDQFQKISDLLKDFENLRTVPEIKNVEVAVSQGIQLTESDLILSISGNLPYLP